MANRKRDQRSKTDPRPQRASRYTKTVGTAPHVGRRYVTRGKVRIVWTEQGKRRQRTIGPNSEAVRRQADEMLERTLAALRAAGATERSSPIPGPPPRPTDDTSLTDAIRAVAVALLDLADRLADRVALILRSGDP
ncbi:MAG: hypothetical protein V3T28_08490 [Gemmatimonadales bacterium]